MAPRLYFLVKIDNRFILVDLRIFVLLNSQSYASRCYGFMCEMFIS